MSKANELCEWSPEDKDGDGNTWQTACNKWFDFESDGPEENAFQFCPFCGGDLLATDVPD